MNCKVAKRLISAFVDGELGHDKTALLSQHLASCRVCREEMAVLKRTVEAIGVCGDIEPSFTLADIRERAARRQPASLVPAWLREMPRLATAAMVLAALAAGSISGIYYGSHKGSQSQSHAVVSAQRVSSSFGLDAFDDGLAGAMYAADAKTHSSSEVTR